MSTLAVPKLDRAGTPVAVPVRVLFALFLFSIPFESIDLGFESQTFSITKFIGFVFFAACLTQPRITLRAPRPVFYFFFAYCVVLAALILAIGPQFTSAAVLRLEKIIQMLVLLWTGSNLMEDETVSQEALQAIAAGVLTLTFTQFAGITAKDAGDRLGRESALNENPNTVAGVLSTGLLAVIGLTYARARSRKWLLVGLAVATLMLLAIVRTGSRGMFLAFLASASVFGLAGANRRSLLFRLPFVVGFLAIAVWSAVQSDVMLARVNLTIQEGSLAQREAILPAAWEMFAERPLVGFLPVEHLYELGARLGEEASDTHNLYLWVLTETGILGGFPFIGGLAICTYMAFRGRRGPEGTTPLAMMVFLLVSNMSGTDHNRKLFWWILAYACASARPSKTKALAPVLQPKEKLARRQTVALRRL